MKLMHNILELKEDDYEYLIIKLFCGWCEAYSRSTKMYQILLTSKPIQNWFNAEMQKLYKQFKDEVAPYTDLSKTDKLKLFTLTSTKIYEIYPKSILTEYKRAIKNTEKYTLNIN